MEKSDSVIGSYPKNRYLYNGKELNSDKMTSESLNWYDYGTRFYDPQICRFVSIDKLASTFPWWTPYQYAGNTPVWAIDLDGLEPLFSTSDFFQGLRMGETALHGPEKAEKTMNYYYKGAADAAVMAITSTFGVGLGLGLTTTAAKAIISGGTDAALQFGNNLLQGKSLSQSVNDIDLVSVTASSLLGGGSLSTAKTVTTAVVDAAVDIDLKGNVSTVLDNKPVINSLLDLVTIGTGNLKGETKIIGTKTNTNSTKEATKTLTKGNSILEMISNTFQSATFGSSGIINKGVQNAIEEEKKKKN